MNENTNRMSGNAHRERRELTVRMRRLMVLAVLGFVGIVDIVKAVYRHDIVEVLVVAAILVVVSPIAVYCVGRYSMSFGGQMKMTKWRFLLSAFVAMTAGCVAITCLLELRLPWRAVLTLIGRNAILPVIILVFLALKKSEKGQRSALRE